jgi:hypothetical protein
VATVSGNSVIESGLYSSARPLRGLGRELPGPLNPLTGETVGSIQSVQDTARELTFDGVTITADKPMTGEQALGPDAGKYAAGGALLVKGAKLAYNVYQALTDVPLSERDIYIDAGSGGDAGDAGALIKQSEAEATPTKKDRVKKALAEAKADPKQIAAEAAEVEVKAKDPSFWDDFADAGRGIYAKCTKLDDNGVCIGKWKFDWKTFAGSAKDAYVLYKAAKGETPPSECLGANAAACLIAGAREEKAKLAGEGVPGADSPVPNPSNEDVLQSWLGAIADADSEKEIDNIVEAAKRVGIGGDYLKRIEDAARAAKAKLASKKTMLYVGLGVGVVALAALVIAKRR